LRVLPDNSWDIYLDTVDKANKIIIQTIGNEPIGPLLNQFIHILAFQQGICLARWVVNNPELIKRLNSIQSYTKEEFDEIAALIKSSVEKLSH